MGYDFHTEMNFSGGENQTDARDQLKSNQLAKVTNYDLRDIYNLRLREGTKDVLGGFVQGTTRRIILFEYVNVSTELPVKMVLQLIDGEIIDSEDGSVLDTGYGEDLDYEVFGNKLYIISDGRYRVFDGTTFSEVVDADPASILAEVKKCKFIEQRGSRMFATGHPTLPNALYFSEVNKPNQFLGSTGNPFMAITDDSDAATGLKEYNGNLLFFKRNAIFAWDGFDPLVDVRFKRIRAHSGCVAYRTICYVGDILMFLGTDGVYALFGTYENAMSTVKMSNNVTPTIREIKLPTDSLQASACAVFYKDKYLLSIPTEEGGYTYATTDDFLYVTTDNDIYVTQDLNYNRNNVILAFHYNSYKETEELAWTIYEGVGVHDMLVDRDGKALLARNNTGFIAEFDPTITYDSSEDNYIVTRIETRPISAKAPFHIKKFRRSSILLDLEAMVGNFLMVEAFVDDVLVFSESNVTSQILEYDTDGKVFDAAVWYAEGATTYPIPIKEKGMRLKYVITSTQVIRPYTFYGIGIEYRIKKPNKSADISEI